MFSLLREIVELLLVFLIQIFYGVERMAIWIFFSLAFSFTEINGRHFFRGKQLLRFEFLTFGNRSWNNFQLIFPCNLIDTWDYDDQFRIKWQFTLDFFHLRFSQSNYETFSRKSTCLGFDFWESFLEQFLRAIQLTRDYV